MTGREGKRGGRQEWRERERGRCTGREGEREEEDKKGGRERKGDSPESEEVGQGYNPQSQAPVKYFSSKALPPKSSQTFPTRPTN